MTCPDPTAKLFFVHWLFDFWQLAGILGVYELMKFLWRKSRA